MPDLPVNAWIDKSADKLAARGQLPKGRSSRNNDPISAEALQLLLHQLKVQSALDRAGPSYREGEQVPGWDQWSGKGQLPMPGELNDFYKTREMLAPVDPPPQQLYDALVTGYDKDT